MRYRNLLIPGLVVDTYIIFTRNMRQEKLVTANCAASTVGNVKPENIFMKTIMCNSDVQDWNKVQGLTIDNRVVTTYHTAPPAETKYNRRSNSCPPVTSLATWRLVIQTNAVSKPIICAFIASAVPGNTLETLHFAGTRLLVPDTVD